MYDAYDSVIVQRRYNDTIGDGSKVRGIAGASNSHLPERADPFEGQTGSGKNELAANPEPVPRSRFLEQPRLSYVTPWLLAPNCLAPSSVRCDCKLLTRISNVLAVNVR